MSSVEIRTCPVKITSALAKVTVLMALLWLVCSNNCIAQGITTQGIAKGPSQIKVENDLATISLPAGYAYVEKELAVKVLQKNGDPARNVVGLILPAAKDDKSNNFAVIVSFDDCGYVSDGDAGKLNANDILNSYKDSTKDQNDRRQKLGLAPIYVGGWAVSPSYEKASHQVIWAINVKEKDSSQAPVVSVNYNTRVLGRRGVLSLNLVTDPDKLETNKPKLAELLNDTTFDRGQAYADYKPGSDKAAGYGIAGLILGGGALAAAKFGLLGGFGKWIIGGLLLMKKFIIVGIAAVGAFFAKLFKRKKPPQS